MNWIKQSNDYREAKSKNMNEITIKNITQKDFERQQIRILAHQKEMFPPEHRGFPKTYDVTIICSDQAYSCTYKIGSKDGKARSGVLKLKEGLADATDYRMRQALILKEIGNNKYRLISNTL